MTTIFEAIDRADFGLAWQLVQSRAGLEEIDDESGLTPLALAAETGMTEVVRTLLEAGASPDHGGALTPLEAAVLEGDPEIVRLLIDAGADLNRRSGDGFTPLMSASMAGDEELARMLLEAGARVRAKNNDGDTAIEVAAKHGYPDLAKELRTFSRKDFEAEKARREAEALEEQERRLRERRERLARARVAAEEAAPPDLLPALEESASPAGESEGEETAASSAAEDAQDRMADSRAPESVSEPEPEEDSAPLKWTWSSDDRHGTTSPATSVGAGEVGTPSTAGEALAAFDALFGSLDDDSAAEVDADSLRGVARFRALLASGREDEALAMLDEGEIEPGDRDRGETPLMVAASQGSFELVETLIEAGAEIDARAEGFRGETALVKAVRHPSRHREAVIRRLVEAGASLEIRVGENAMTPLMFAANADVYEPDPHGSVFGGTVRLLVDLGARLEATDRRGATAWRMVKRNALGAPTSSPFRRRLYQMQKLLETVGAVPMATRA
ncbi:MAG: ankyrin repeat domain-containing protein [Holophagales bacterium]|nr:ankyrin repeat domain-containing protein [Holophagales bacterium]